ncbi:site-specific integrase [Undibacterium sp. Di26W]|uniref:site-specific integrase n=1 Tax=Undibacterium sp. Di26W TaxID=3413035 RepID=UPI003BF1A4CB
MMKPMLASEFTPEFDRCYQTHLKRLKLAGLRPKTIEAYSQGLRRAAAYFDCQIDALSEAQLTDYFAQLLTTHSWSTLKHDLYGLKFYYDKILHRPWPAPNLVKAPHSQRLPDIVTVAQMQQIIVVAVGAVGVSGNMLPADVTNLPCKGGFLEAIALPGRLCVSPNDVIF